VLKQYPIQYAEKCEMWVLRMHSTIFAPLFFDGILVYALIVFRGIYLKLMLTIRGDLQNLLVHNYFTSGEDILNRG